MRLAFRACGCHRKGRRLEELRRACTHPGSVRALDIAGIARHPGSRAWNRDRSLSLLDDGVSRAVAAAAYFHLGQGRLSLIKFSSGTPAQAVLCL